MQENRAAAAAAAAGCTAMARAAMNETAAAKAVAMKVAMTRSAADAAAVFKVATDEVAAVKAGAVKVTVMWPAADAAAVIMAAAVRSSPDIVAAQKRKVPRQPVGTAGASRMGAGSQPRAMEGAAPAKARDARAGSSVLRARGAKRGCYSRGATETSKLSLETSSRPPPCDLLLGAAGKRVLWRGWRLLQRAHPPTKVLSTLASPKAPVLLFSASVRHMHVSGPYDERLLDHPLSFHVALHRLGLLLRSRRLLRLRARLLDWMQPTHHHLMWQHLLRVEMRPASSSLRSRLPML